MQIKRLTPHFAVSPQIESSDVATIAAEGFGTIICNRPDAEVLPMQAAEAIRTAAEAAGLTFVINPVTHQGLNAEMVAIQRQTQDDADAPVFAYCASGTRSTIVWALGQAGNMATDDILNAALEQGYDLGGLRSQLDNLAAQKG